MYFETFVLTRKAPVFFSLPVLILALLCHVVSETVPIDTNEVIIKQLNLIGSFRYANTYPRGIELVSSGKIDVAKLISCHFTLDQSESALLWARDAKEECIKVVVTP